MHTVSLCAFSICIKRKCLLQCSWIFPIWILADILKALHPPYCKYKLRMNYKQGENKWKSLFCRNCWWSGCWSKEKLYRSNMYSYIWVLSFAHLVHGIRGSLHPAWPYKGVSPLLNIWPAKAFGTVTVIKHSHTYFTWLLLTLHTLFHKIESYNHKDNERLWAWFEFDNS